jgi:glycerate 2-kinase
MRALVIPDKFKGTLTAQAAAQAIARGWCRARPEDTLDLLPMSDGGDGFGEVTSSRLQAKAQPARWLERLAEQVASRLQSRRHRLTSDA